MTEALTQRRRGGKRDATDKLAACRLSVLELARELGNLAVVIVVGLFATNLHRPTQLTRPLAVPILPPIIEPGNSVHSSSNKTVTGYVLHVRWRHVGWTQPLRFPRYLLTGLDGRATPKVRGDRDPHERSVLGTVHHAGERGQAADDTDDMFGFRPRGLSDDGPLNLSDLLYLALAEKESRRGGPTNGLR